MDFDREIKIQTKRLLDGATYQEIREELLERFYPEDALQIATESYKGYRKEKVKSFFKYLFINTLLLIVVYFIAPTGHALRPKISYIIWFFLIVKIIYDWYRIRQSDKEFAEASSDLG